MLQERNTILIVDDDAGARLLMLSALERDGYVFQEAADGVEALEMIEQVRPQLVLVDALMPRMDGFELCQRIRDLPDGDEVPVLMITALLDESSVEQAFDSGAQDFIPKPVHWPVLRQRVRRLLEAQGAKRAFETLSYRDGLTGLANRRLFNERLGMAIARSRRTQAPISVLMLDVDNFKVINDTLGHDAGDKVVRLLADRLVHCLRDADTVARPGGDEFAIVLEGMTRSEEVTGVAYRLLDSVREPIYLDGRMVVVTASIGVAHFPRHGDDIASLIKHAETAMYGAKRQGGNAYLIYAEEMSKAATRRLLLESNLRQAVERDQLRVYYQPQFSVLDGTLIGFEALLRWQHPELGLVSPGDFIPLAEETGLIVDVGEWVLRASCAELADWPDVPGLPPPRLSVNLSGRQASQSGLVAMVEQALDDSCLDPARLVLELTESTLLRNDETTAHNLDSLSSIGVQLAVDDFGTGYSTLRCIKEFPIDIIKIDRSFVAGVPAERDDVAIIQSIAALARGLGLTVVAEGIETEQQLEFLRQQGCDEAQGFLLGRPAPLQQHAPSPLRTARGDAPDLLRHAAR